MKETIHYSEAFKMEVVREMETRGLNAHQVQKKYGIRSSATVPVWARKYGNGLMGKVIRVETTKDIDERKRLQGRVRALESLLADTNLELALERQYTRLACQQAGIEDVAEFKKKGAGKRRTEPSRRTGT